MSIFVRLSVKTKTTVLSYPPYSPDLIPYNFSLFPELARSLQGGSSWAPEQFHINAVSSEAVDRRAPNNSKNWQWTTEGDDLHLLLMALNDRTASSSQLAACWSTAIGVLMSASSIRRHNDGRNRATRYAFERCLPECVIERHNGLTPEVMVRGAISYHGRSNLQRIESNLNNNRYVREVLQPDVVPFLQGIRGAIFQQDIARPHVAKTVRDFCSAQHMQLVP
ncbi:uncharacterized protein TNCV_3231981 [Trichonephila clavipes]|nr:uncharacterized protein TNCV_3231981 [Trichonephila clavipes]